MPYLKPKDRVALVPLTHAIDQYTDLTPGQLNYVITRLCQAYIGPDPCYGAFNDVIGALECAKMELYRRAAAPYEDRKIEENGDVY